MTSVQLPFFLCHGSNNRFILIDEEALAQPFDDAYRQRISQLVAQLDQDFSVDGTLFYAEKGVMSPADCSMRMFNLDGTEAEMCGNGLRCVARLAMEKLNRSAVAVATQKSVLQVSKAEGFLNHIPSYRSEIGPVSSWVSEDGDRSVDASWIDCQMKFLDEVFSESMRYTALRMPNPHLVGISAQISKPDQVFSAWEHIQRKALFPEGINFSVASVLSTARENQIFVRTCERGVGLTDACGTAMAAASMVVKQRKLMSHADEKITVLNAGGFVYCEPQQSRVWLTGNATWVCEGVLTVDFEKQSIMPHETQAYTQEKTAYQAVQSFSEQQLRAEFGR